MSQRRCFYIININDMLNYKNIYMLNLHLSEKARYFALLNLT